jgi:DNA-binding NtrC family response regulator
MTSTRTAANQGRALIVEDDGAVRNGLSECLRRDGWQVVATGTCAEARQLAPLQPKLIVSDVRLPDGDGIALMRELKRKLPSVSILLLTAYGNVPQAVEAMRDGAFDYLQKPVPFSQIRDAARRVLSGAGAEMVAPADGVEMVGNSPLLRCALDTARQAARSDADVLIEAESGTGKELLARLIHQESRRHRQPFVAVNCAALPESLLESELFGYAKGAFTGALSSRTGSIAAADRGTLLLDEIGEMPLAIQPKLLRVLQEREVVRLGESRPQKVDVRVIATTNRSLLQRVEQGAFRLDLYYRLNVIPLTLPPLKDRPEDIPMLAEYFLKRYRPEARAKMSTEFLEGLIRHSWPGNVRELANLMRRIAVLCTADEIGSKFLEPVQAQKKSPSRLAPGVSLRDAERELLEVTLRATEGNRTRAAELMGVSLRTIRNKIRDYGLPPRRYA